MLGRDSYAGGNGSAALGVACHYTIALGMGFAHYLVARRFAALVRHPYLLGAAYGAALYAVMNFVVLPLSAVRRPSFDNVIWVTASVAAHLGFGIVFAHTSRIALRGIQAPWPSRSAS